MIAEGLLTCSVSVLFTSGLLQFFLLYQRFVERSIRVSISVIGAVALDLCVFVWAVFFELFRSVALLLGAFESSSAWMNDDKDDDSLYSRAPRVATPAWLKATSTPSFVCCVCPTAKIFLSPG